MDLVRELGVLFRPSTLARIYRQLGEACFGNQPPTPPGESVIRTPGANQWDGAGVPLRRAIGR